MGQLVPLHLGHGDLLVMAGSMQETHEHGVRVSAAKAHAQQSRVNITVRAFKPDS
jgi:alkylated DNA repair dioxygenase AlkB